MRLDRADKAYTKNRNLIYRDVAQLVARVLWEHDVAGSNPVIPTKNEDLSHYDQVLVPF